MTNYSSKAEYSGNSIVEIKRNLKPVHNSGPPFSARLPNDPNNIPMRLVSDASDSDTETLVPSTITPQAVSTAKRSAIVTSNDLYRPGTHNVAPKGSHSPRKKFNERHRGGLSREFYDNKHRSVLADINNRSHEYYHVAFSPTETSNEQSQPKASDVNVLTEGVET